MTNFPAGRKGAFSSATYGSNNLVAISGHRNRPRREGCLSHVRPSPRHAEPDRGRLAENAAWRVDMCSARGLECAAARRRVRLLLIHGRIAHPSTGKCACSAALEGWVCSDNFPRPSLERARSVCPSVLSPNYPQTKSKYIGRAACFCNSESAPPTMRPARVLHRRVCASCNSDARINHVSSSVDRASYGVSCASQLCSTHGRPTSRTHAGERDGLVQSSIIIIAASACAAPELMCSRPFRERVESMPCTSVS